MALRHNVSRKTALVVLISSALLVACGGGGGGGGEAPPSGYPQSALSCEAAGQRAWLRDYMNDQYLWYDKQGVPNEAAGSLGQYLDSLLYKPIDRYSYVQATEQADQLFVEGKRTGYGYALAWADTAKTILKVRLVEPLSPVAAAGLLRGETIVTIDGKTPVQISNGELVPVTKEGVSRAFVVKDALGVQRSFNALSKEFDLSPVIASKVLVAPNGAKTGYLMYQEFIRTGATAMGLAFDFFRKEGVTELILDLRYNGGGSTLEARNLASMIGGSALAGSIFAKYRFSDKKSASNVNQGFVSTGLPAAPLENLARVFVITSGDTASASEMVINGLKPFKNVVTIGATTYGKPYGFQPRSSCGSTVSAVNIEIANAQDFADYSKGFAPTCAMSDDLTRQLGDPAELRTQAALSYISTGACPPVATTSQKNQASAQSNTAQEATKNIANGVWKQDAGFGEMSPRQARLDY
jgi:carboxyl-terminal processing protease